MNTKLIIVEGLPGSGKSTTAQFIANQLNRNQYKAYWYFEVGLEHPVDFMYESCMNETEYLKLINSFPDYKSILQSEVLVQNNHYFFQYLIIKRKYHHQLPKDLIDYLELFDITKLPFSTYFEYKLNRWKKYAERAIHSDEITVIESSFFQGPIVELLLNDCDHSLIQSTINELKLIIDQLNPTLIYYYQTDVKKSLENLFNFRGPGFTQYVIDLVVNSQYGHNRTLKGMEVAVQFFSEYRLLADQFFNTLKMNKLSIDNTNQNWEAYRLQITQFLNITYINDYLIDNPKQYEGKYQNKMINKDWEIKLEENHLYVYLNETYKSKLIPIDQNTFQIEGNTINLVFLKNHLGSNDRFMISGRETAASYGELGLIFIRL